MRVLVLCTTYSLSRGHSWLVDSLAEHLALKHEVVVVFLDWSGKIEAPCEVERAGVRVHVFPVQSKYYKGKLGIMLKWFFAARAIKAPVRKILSEQQFDLVLNFSPALIMDPLRKMLSARIARSYLVLWDFFPIYHYQLGLVPGLLAAPLRAIENSAYNNYDTIGVMSPRNLEFLKENYRLTSKTVAEVLYLWGPDAVFQRTAERYLQVRAQHDIGESLVCVFGGQLIRGRGIARVIELALFAKQNAIDAKFYIFGDGPERQRILDDLVSHGVEDSVLYMGFRPRDEYIEFLMGADVGLVFNSGDVEVPTFPSKAIDFFRAAVPVLAYVEDATDFGAILEGEIGAGWSASPSNQALLVEHFKAAAQAPRETLFSVGRAGQEWYVKHMTVSTISEQVLRSVASSRAQ
ncbi:glycosyltransferase [Pseudomonas soli]|uniref:glycosyltransferase n=1 Tax=Pseudomonas soli TaxID=1306993 RepID=UPI0003C78211|nr:hypothetical protein O165_002640 [Pseudomonas soli]